MSIRTDVQCGSFSTNSTKQNRIVQNSTNQYKIEIVQNKNLYKFLLVGGQINKSCYLYAYRKPGRLLGEMNEHKCVFQQK